MSKIFLLIALVGTISLIAASTDVSLSGTVKDESGAAIEGVSLSLAKEPSLKTTTNAQGAFTLAGRTATLHRAPYDIAIQNSLNVGSKSNTLRFSISADGIGGSISFFNASGRSVSYLPLNDLRAGTNYILLPKLSTGFYLARITVDNRTSTCILVSTSSGVYISERVPSGFSPSLSKSTTGEPGAVDTIIAKKEGFETVKKVIASYTLENVEIIMKRVVLEECTPTQLPATSALPVNKGLPSPFRFFDGTEMTRKDEWPCRRQEILDMAYKYMYGLPSLLLKWKSPERFPVAVLQQTSRIKESLQR